MTTILSLWHRWLHFALAIAGLSLIGVVVLGEAAQGKGAKRAGTRAARMVDAIVNRNPPPKLVYQEDKPKTVFLYPERYDWKEERRVEKAVAQLLKEASSEVWEELVRRGGDERYCLPLTSQEEEGSHVCTVGYVCRERACAQLVDVFHRHLPHLAGKKAERIDLVYLDLDIWDLPEWREERKHKPLYQLQIEVCEAAIRAGKGQGQRCVGGRKGESTHEDQGRDRGIEEDEEAYFSPAQHLPG
jgi:hypothetical protein